MNMNVHSVIYASDERGVMPLGIAMHSLVKQAAGNTRYDVYVLSNGITAASRARLGRLTESPRNRHRIIFVDVPPTLLAGHLETEAWPVAAWARIFIPQLLPDVEGVVLYLDIDTLVCQDLHELLTTPLNGKAVGAVLEHLSHAGSHFNARLGIPESAPGYFNSGVLLMDLDRFRDQGLVQQILEYAATHRQQLFCPDQDALNGVLCNNLQPIHHKWNWHDGLTRLMLKRSRTSRLNRGAPIEHAVEAALRPGILHYQGANKPWRYNYRIERERYTQAIRESGFGEYPLPGRTMRLWIKAWLYKPVYWLTWQKLKRLDAHFKKCASAPKQDTTCDRQ